MKLGYVITYVDDVVETLSFYEKAFGLKIRMKFEENGIVDYGEMETEGAILGFASNDFAPTLFEGDYQKSDLNNKPFGQEIVFISEDVHRSYNTAIENGAISLKEPIEKPWGQTVCYLRSKEGTLIEICSPMNQ